MNKSGDNLTIGEKIPQDKNSHNKNFHNRSEVAQEIISRKPDFIEKWALYFLLGILILLFGGTWFIQYPDVIKSRAVLSDNNGPKEIIPLQTGRLIKLFVQDGEDLKQGDVIGWIKSSANTSEILKLSRQLDSSTVFLSEERLDLLSKLFDEHFLNLGRLQSSYQTFISALQQLNDYKVNGFYVRRKNIILNEIYSISQIHSALLKQKQLIEKDYKFSEQSYNINEQLYKQKTISFNEYRQKQSKLLKKQMALPQINANILSNQNTKRDKLEELDQLDRNMLQEKTTLEQALETLKRKIDEWKHQYIITAQIDGKIFFIPPIQQNQFVEKGKILGSLSTTNNKYYAQLNLPQNNFGKINTGMKVQLRFDAYPYEEVGFVTGELEYISPIASDSGYLAIVKLENGLKTNLNRTIQYKKGLSANALIITKNMRLSKRLYYMIVKATSAGS